MRITFVLPHAGLAGGIRVVAIYAERLKRRGHEVCVVSVPRKQKTLREKVRMLARGQGWPAAGRGEASHMEGVDVEWRVLEKWRPVVDRDVPEADVVVATWWETAEWVAGLSASRGAKAYFIQHDERIMAWEGWRERVTATWRMPLYKIVISQWLKDMAENEFADRNVSLVPNGVDMRQFAAPAREKQTRPAVGMLYATTPFKGCDVSLAALAQVRKEMPEVQLRAYGAVPVNQELALPEGSAYFLQPPQERIAEVYAGCDVWLCGSRKEGFHLPPLEAMACRCPVVSTRVGGAVEIVEEGLNGFLVDVEDVGALAEGVLRILRQNDAAWRRMSDAAHSTAQRFDWETSTDLMEAALERATTRSSSRAMAGVMN